ncbi:MAG TPA: hypothetical protein VKU40_14810 [Thermoanaerobaculia bacterium]|nr:hypothetical protein [Thermoanaerobaculia bacterium]
MRRSTETPALLALALALALLAAVPAGACSYAIDPDRTSGPFPSPDGGAWFVLPRFDDGSLEAVHFAADGNATRTVRLGAPGLDLLEPIFGSFAATADGGFRVSGRPRDDGGFDRFLVAFDADGTPLGRAELTDLEIFGFDAAGDAYAYRRQRDWRLAVHRLDAAAGLASELFVTVDPVMPGAEHSCGDPFTLASDGEGGIFLLTTLGGDGFGASAAQVLQRFSADGVETAAWRLPEDERYQLQQGAPGTVVLVEGGYPAVLWAIGEDGLLGHTLLDGEGFNRLVAGADGGWVLRYYRDVRWLDSEAEVRGRMRLGPTPQGAAWSDLRERLEDAAGTPVARALWGHGAEAEEARAELLAAGPGAVDQVVDWLARQPPSGDAHEVGYTELLEALLAADPDGTGLRLVALFDRLPAAERVRVVHLLTLEWPRPAAAYVALLEDALRGPDDRLRNAAASAFEWSPRGGLAEAAVRFPASARVQRFYLRALAASEGKQPEGVNPEAFLQSQLPHVAPRLDAVFVDPAHPARPRAIEWLENLPSRLGPPVEEHAVLEAALARWSAKWSRSADPRLAAAARLVAAACGDPDAVATLASGLADGSYGSWPVLSAYRRLRDAGSALADRALVDRLTAAALTGRLEPGEAVTVLRLLGNEASPDWWLDTFLRLADPELPPAAAEAVSILFTGSYDDEPPEVPAAAVVAVLDSAFLDRRLATGDRTGFLLAATAWHNLAGEPAARERLEATFLDACRQELEAMAEPSGTANAAGRSEPSGCLAAMAVNGVGRQVPDAWLTAHTDLLRQAASHLSPYRFLPTLSSVAARRGAWPGLAELFRDLQATDVDALHESVDAAVLAAALGGETHQVGGRSLADLPLLDLPELQGTVHPDLREER